ncbi:MAG: ChaN family lipoprotein [Desulfobacter sp.]|nr:MAG: ChaN family lipoprotein [Desulfobacter sp.]
MRTLIILAALIPLAYSCATAPKAVKRSDPLIGKIIKGTTGKEISYDHLLDALAAADVIYLSEKHDNPMHHAAQQRIISDLADSGRSPILGFEFFPVKDTPLLLNLMDSKKAGHSPDIEKAVETRMRQKLGWEDQSDTMWSFYWNLLTLARDKGLTAGGLDLVPSLKRRITRKGIQGITPLEKTQIFSTGLNDPAYKTHMTGIFKNVHCGMDHGRMTDRLYDTWLARNDRMALSITELHRTRAKGTGPVVVIMGNGHTEYGLGVMDRVRHLSPDISQVNLAMTEISREPADLAAYLAPLDLQDHPPAPPGDFLWFTQRVSYEDPCLKFRKALEKMRKKKME